MVCQDGWLVGLLMSQEHVSVSQGLICSDNFTCCHTEIEVADQTFHLIILLLLSSSSLHNYINYILVAVITRK